VTHWSLDSELSVDGGEKCGPDGEFDEAEHCESVTGGLAGLRDECRGR
jgi:hypothetical protein